MGLKSFTALQLTLKSASQVVLPDTYVPGSSSDQNQTVHVNDFGVQRSLVSTSTPAPTQVLAESVTIDATGSYEIDLTAAKIVGAVDVSGNPTDTEDLTGAKLMYIEVHTGSANVGVLTIAPSAVNGYDLFGAAMTQGIKLPAGSHFNMLVESSALNDVAAADKGITFTGTLADTFDVVMVFEA